MHKIIAVGGLVAIMGFGSAAIAQSKPLEQNSQADLAPSNYLIASPFRSEISPAHQRRHRLMKMLVLQMEISEMAEEAMASDDPQVKAMAAEMLRSSDKMTSQLLRLIQSSPRSGQFSR